MTLRRTRTYVILELSPSAYAEIRKKLVDAGYHHAIHGDLLDMDGLAVGCEAQADVLNTEEPEEEKTLP